MPTNSNDTDPQLPDATHALPLEQDEQVADRAVLGEWRVTKSGSSDYALWKASGKTDSSDSSSAGSHCDFQTCNYSILTYANRPQSAISTLFRPC